MLKLKNLRAFAPTGVVPQGKNRELAIALDHLPLALNQKFLAHVLARPRAKMRW